MRKTNSLWSVAEPRLLTLKQRGVQSDVLEARLEYAEANVLLTHHILPMVGKERVYPRMLPTQASGRWSTVEPPLVNFTADTRYGPHGIRDVVIPDPDHVWIEHDLDQIEAKIIAALSGDEQDLLAFQQGWDVHMLLWCELQGWDRPPVLTKRLFLEDSCADWRAKYQWQSPDDRRRRLAKNCRYAMSYALNEKGMDKYAAELEMSRETLRDFGKRFLRLRPKLVECKRRHWEQNARLGIARTFLGRRRLLLGDWKTRAKEGWNHEIQGAVTDITNSHVIAISHAYPQAVLKQNKHDGLIFDFPSSEAPDIQELRQLVETEWTIEGRTITSTAEWKRIA